MGFVIFALVASILMLKICSKWYFYKKSQFSQNYVFSNGYKNISVNSTPIDLKFSAYVPLDTIYDLLRSFFF